jgi:sensor histidine kinase YesM
MNESLEVIVEMIAIVSFVAGVVNYTIIKPLKIAIDTLTVAVNKLENLLHQVEDDERKLRERVKVNETRIETLMDEVETLKEYHKQPVGGKYS